LEALTFLEALESARGRGDVPLSACFMV